MQLDFTKTNLDDLRQHRDNMLYFFNDFFLEAYVPAWDSFYIELHHLYYAIKDEITRREDAIAQIENGG